MALSLQIDERGTKGTRLGKQIICGKLDGGRHYRVLGKMIGE